MLCQFEGSPDSSERLDELGEELMPEQCSDPEDEASISLNFATTGEGGASNANQAPSLERSPIIASLFSGIPPFLRFVKENETVHQFPPFLNDKLIWRNSTLTPNVVKRALWRSNFRILNTCRECVHELFGFDILLDSSLKPWLLEVNVSPSLHTSSALDNKIKTEVVVDMLNIAGYRFPPMPKYFKSDGALRQCRTLDLLLEEARTASSPTAVQPSPQSLDTYKACPRTEGVQDFLRSQSGGDARLFPIHDPCLLRMTLSNNERAKHRTFTAKNQSSRADFTLIPEVIMEKKENLTGDDGKQIGPLMADLTRVDKNAYKVQSNTHVEAYNVGQMKTRVTRIIAEPDQTDGEGDRKDEDGNHMEDTDDKCDVLEFLGLRVEKVTILPMAGGDCYQ
nr:unnamed protein product [Spirometra erinaceieuropaei]